MNALHYKLQQLEEENELIAIVATQKARIADLHRKLQQLREFEKQFLTMYDFIDQKYPPPPDVPSQ